MNLLLITMLGAVALFSATALVVLATVGGQSPIQARLAKLAAVPGSDKQHYTLRSMVSSVGGALASLRRPLRLTADEGLIYRLGVAGYRQAEDADTFLNAKILCTVLGVLAATFTGSGNMLVFSFVFGALGYFAPDLFLIKAISRRKTQIGLALPNALDLLVVCMEAGLGMDQAVLRVGTELEISSPALSEELVMLSREQRAGKPRVEAWRSLADRVDLDSVRQFASMLTQSERLGTPIARALAEFSDNLRTKRLYQAEERAAKTTIKLIFPLVLFILPAMFVVILGPAGLELIRVFDEMSP
jgi:tight adherence protein C